MCRQRTLLYYCGCELVLGNLERCEDPHESCFNYGIQVRKEPCPRSLCYLEQGLPLHCCSLGTMTMEQQQAIKKYALRYYDRTIKKNDNWGNWEEPGFVRLFEISTPECDGEREAELQSMPKSGSQLSVLVQYGNESSNAESWRVVRMTWVFFVIVAWVRALDNAYLTAFELLEELQHIETYYARRGWATGQLTWREMRLFGLLVRRMLLVCRWLLWSWV